MAVLLPRGAAVVPASTGAAASPQRPTRADRRCRLQCHAAAAAHEPGPGTGQVYTGRLLLKRGQQQQQQHRKDWADAAIPASLQELRGSLPRGVVPEQRQQHDHPEHQQQPPWQSQLREQQQQHSDAQPLSDHHHHQQQQQQQARLPLRPQQSLKDKNMSFSGALRRTKALPDLLQLLANPQWGPDLADLDAVSVVGALVWLMKSAEWQRLQQHGSVGQQEWQLQRSGQACIQLLLDRAEALVMPGPHNSNSSSSAGPQGSGSSSGGSSSSNVGLSSSQAAGSNDTGPLMRPAELANLIYVTSKLQQQRPRLLAAAAAALTLDLYACSTDELNRLIWGLASARVNPGEAWLLGFCKADQAHFLEASPGQLATSVYGLARLGYRPPDVWIASWLEASLPRLGGFAARHLANAAWGLSQFRFQAPGGWLSAFYAATSATMDDLTPPGVSQLSHALVILGGGQPPPRPWTQQLLAAARPMFRDMELLQLCNLGWALGNWQYKPEEDVVTEWLDASLPLLPAATPVDLSVLLWACDKLEFIPQQRWLEAWFAAAAAALPRCEPLQLSTIAVVLGNWGLVPVPGFSIDFWRSCKARFPDFSPYQLSLLVLGLGKARRSVPHTWASSLLSTFTHSLLPQADPGDVCRLLGGLGAVVVKPTGSRAWVAGSAEVQQQLAQCVAALLPGLGAVEPPWLVLLVRGLVRLRVPLPPSQVQALNDAAIVLDERLTPHHRKALMRAFGQLRELAQDSQGQ